MSTTRLVLIPGLGADARIFGPQLEAFPDAIAPVWIEPARRESLASYAQRMAAGIDASAPLVLAGLSLGGMLALEMARRLPVRRVVLIASCTHPGAVRRGLRAVEIAGRIWPVWCAEWLKSFAPPVMGRGGTVPDDRRRLLMDMIRDTPADFIRWGGRAIFAWPGVPDPGVPVAHIHGALDWVIPIKGVRPTRIIPTGSHVLNLSHPDEVTRFLRENIDAA